MEKSGFGFELFFGLCVVGWCLLFNYNECQPYLICNNKNGLIFSKIL